MLIEQEGLTQFLYFCVVWSINTANLMTWPLPWPTSVFHGLLSFAPDALKKGIFGERDRGAIVLVA